MIVRKPLSKRRLFTVAITILLALLKVTSYADAVDSGDQTPLVSGRPLTEGVVMDPFSERNQDNDETFLSLVTIGDPFNAPDDQGYGSINTIYQIGKYEVTAGQYAAFLNAVAWKEDPHGLYHIEMRSDKKIACIQRVLNEDGTYRYELLSQQRGNLPITYVSLNDAERFCNWLENGSPGRDQDYQLLQQSTESGAYTFFQEGNQMIVETNPKAHYHIPSDDEWIKAAYYKGDGRRAGYWMYPTQNDTAPANGTSNDVANYANYQTYHGGLRSNFLDNELKITTVDCFDRTATFYRAHDMGGNVAEWTIPGGRSGFALVRGGSWNSGYSWYGNNDLMRTVLPKSYDPSTATNFIGFRVAVTIDPKSLPVQKVQAATSDVVKDSSISDGASSEHASSWKISPREQVFFEMMMITGLVLTGTAVGFLTGEVLIDAYAEGISYEVICGILKKKLTAGRLIMIISHILFNAYCITETEG